MVFISQFTHANSDIRELSRQQAKARKAVFEQISQGVYDLASFSNFLLLSAQSSSEMSEQGISWFLKGLVRSADANDPMKTIGVILEIFPQLEEMTVLKESARASGDLQWKPGLSKNKLTLFLQSYVSNVVSYTLINPNYSRTEKYKILKSFEAALDPIYQSTAVDYSTMRSISANLTDNRERIIHLRQTIATSNSRASSFAVKCNDAVSSR